MKRTTAAIKREMKRRATVKPIIGYLKAEYRMDRSCLLGRSGDRIDALLAAVGFNSHLIVRWFGALLCALIVAVIQQPKRAEPA